MISNNPSLKRITDETNPIAQSKPLAFGISKTYAKIYKSLTKGCVKAAKKEV